MQVLANQSDSKARIRVLELVQELSVFFPSEGVLIWDAKSKGFLIDILNELEASSDALSMHGFLESVRDIKQEVVNLPVGQPGEQVAQLSHLKLRLKGLKLELSQAIQGKDAQQQRNTPEKPQPALATPAPQAEEPIDDDDNDIAAKLAELKRKYAESLEQRLNEIVDLWESFNSGDYDEEQVLGLLNRFHKLAGNAASFGYQDLGKQAAELNNQFKSIRESGSRPDDDAIATISAAISRLLDFGNVRRPESSPEPIETQPEDEPQQQHEAESRSQQLLYLVDDDTSLAQFLSLQLEHQGYAVRLLSSPEQLGEAIAQTPPALVLMDISFPEGETAGIDVINRLRKSQRLRQPVIFVSQKDDLQTRMAAARARADGYFSKPIDVGQLVDSIYNLTNRSQTRERHVAVLHESPDSSKDFCTRLAGLGMQASCVETPEQLLNMLDQSGTDILVLSNTAGGLNGIDLAMMLHQQYQYQNLPIILLDSDNVQLDQLDLLGNVHSFRESSDDQALIELIETISQQQLRLRQTAKEAARKDELTGLHSRSHFMQLLELLQASARLDDKQFDLLLIKLEDFESINARSGIDAGDAVIRETADILRETCESTDLIARLGDDEFCLVTSDDAAIHEKAERIRSAISGHSFSFNSDPLAVEVTFGMSRIDGKSGARAAISEAIGAIYRSRQEAIAAANAATAKRLEQQQKPPASAQAPAAATRQQTSGQQPTPANIASSSPAAAEKPAEKLSPKPAAAAAKPPEAPKVGEKIREASMRYQAVVSLHGGNGEHYSASLCINTSSGSELSVDHYLNDFGHPAMAHPLIHRTIDLALSDIKSRKQPAPTLFIDLPESCVLDARLAVWIANRFKKENFQNNPFVFLLHEKSLLNPVPGLNRYIKALTTAGSRVGIHSVSSEKPLQAALTLGQFSFLRLHRRMLSEHGSHASNLMNGILQLAHKNNLQVIGCGVESPEILTFSWSSQLDFVQGNFIHKPAGVMNFEFMKFQ